MPGDFVIGTDMELGAALDLQGQSRKQAFLRMNVWVVDSPKRAFRLTIVLRYVDYSLYLYTLIPFRREGEAP